MLKKSLSKSALMVVLITGNVIWGGTAVHAEEPQHFLLDEYVVTATRNPVKEFDANANISVVTKQEIENHHYQNVKEAIQNVPGVNISSYASPGYVTSNSIMINGSNKVLFLIDGMRMNQGSESNLYELFNNMDNIERIEVLHGSASSLYGADAQGGVINIITNKFPDYQSKIFAEGGSYDKFRFGVTTQGNENGWGYRFSASKDKLSDAKDGNSNKIPQSNDARNFSVMVAKRLGDDGKKGDISFAYDRYASDYSYMNMYNSSAGTMNYGAYEVQSYRALLNYNFDDSLNNKLSIFRNQRILQPSWGNTNIISFGINEQVTKNFGEKNVLTGGVDYHSDKFLEGYTGYSGMYGMNNMNGTVLKNTAFYLQDIHNFTDKWNMTLGGRYDDSNLFDSKATGNAKVGYKFNDATNMYISYGTFFNTPDIYSLYSGEHGNSNLKAENGNNAEIGLNHKFDDSFVMSTHVFKRKTKDKISYNYVTEKYENLSTEEKAHGFDVQLQKMFSDKWSVSTAYTYLKTEADTNINNSGYLPKHTVDLGVDYNLSKLNTNFALKGIIDRPGPETNDVKGDFFPAESYWIANLGINYRADDNHKFYFKVNNLFDKFYAEQSNARGQWGGDAEQWWTMPGRSFLVGMEYTF